MTSKMMIMTLTRFLCLILLLVGLARVESFAEGDDAVKYIQRNIDNNDIMVFAKSYCPHCKNTKALLEELNTEESGWTYGITNLDHMDGEHGSTVQEHLLAMTGQKTVPSIFIGGKHIGGNSDLQALHAANDLLPKLYELGLRRTTAHDEM